MVDQAAAVVTAGTNGDNGQAVQAAVSDTQMEQAGAFGGVTYDVAQQQSIPKSSVDDDFGFDMSTMPGADTDMSITSDVPVVTPVSVADDAPAATDTVGFTLPDFGAEQKLETSVPTAVPAVGDTPAVASVSEDSIAVIDTTVAPEVSPVTFANTPPATTMSETVSDSITAAGVDDGLVTEDDPASTVAGGASVSDEVSGIVPDGSGLPSLNMPVVQEETVSMPDVSDEPAIVIEEGVVEAPVVEEITSTDKIEAPEPVVREEEPELMAPVVVDDLLSQFRALVGQIDQIFALLKGDRSFDIGTDEATYRFVQVKNVDAGFKIEKRSGVAVASDEMIDTLTMTLKESFVSLRLYMNGEQLFEQVKGVSEQSDLEPIILNKIAKFIQLVTQKYQEVEQQYGKAARQRELAGKLDAF